MSQKVPQTFCVVIMVHHRYGDASDTSGVEQQQSRRTLANFIQSPAPNRDPQTPSGVISEWNSWE